MPRPPGSTLFPYTTLFRSLQDRALGDELAVLDADVGDFHADAGVQARGEAGADLEAEQAAAEQRVTMTAGGRSEEHTSELQSRQYLVCRLLLEKKKLSTLH